ncbi:MAG: response regulator [Flavobacteriales bacterium]|nr:response regulator [Flavobacteriales bacterium]
MKLTLTIANKLYIALLSILLLLLFMGITNFYQFRNINQSVSKLFDLKKKTNIYNELRYGVLRSLEANNYLFEGYWGMYDFYNKEVNLIYKNITRLEQLVTTDFEKIEINNIKEAFTKHHQVVQDFNDNKFSLNFSEVKKETSTKINVIQPELLKIIQVVSDYYLNELDQAIVHANRAKSMGQIIILGVSSFAVLLTIFIAFILIRAINNPIIKLKKATDIISKGDYTKKIEIYSKDDLGKLAQSFNIMIHNLNKTKKQVKRTTTNLSTLIQNLSSGVLMEDEASQTMVVNQSFCKLFKIPVIPDKLIEGGFSQSAVQVSQMFVKPEKFVQKIKECINNKKPVFGDELELNDGRIFIRDYLPIHFGDNRIGHLWRYEDISNRKKQEKEVIKAKEAAEAAGIIKENFLANMSHEIRTPMNAILGMAELLKKTEVNEKQKKFIDAINISSKNLLIVINDILDISKLKTGKVKFETIGFEVRSVFNHIIEINEHKLAEKNVLLEYKIASEVEDEVLMGDPYRLTQVLLNLVGNAIKFTVEGCVNIECKLLKQENKNFTLNFSVHDTGIGIPKNKLANIFESFEQADTSTTRKYGGSGLGLAISKQLVEAQKGSISAESIKNVGSTFNFIISYKLGTKDNLLSDIDQPIVKELGNVRVLLVEDHRLNQILATSIMEDWGFEIEIAENGKVAIQKLNEKEYDIILMDIQMPEMGGVEATEYIRNKFNGSKANIPIIALTANAMSTDKEKYLKAGMNDYISKPFNAKILYQKIGNLVTGPRIKTN